MFNKKYYFLSPIKKQSFFVSYFYQKIVKNVLIYLFKKLDDYTDFRSFVLMKNEPCEYKYAQLKWKCNVNEEDFNKIDFKDRFGHFETHISCLTGCLEEKQQPKKTEIKGPFLLYHRVQNEDVLEEILKNGLKSAHTLGITSPILTNKSHDIFFHPLAKDEVLSDTQGMYEQPYVAIKVMLDSGLCVNSRLYSFGVTNFADAIPLHKYKDMTKSQIRKRYDGLPEVRIKVNKIDPKYIVQYGKTSNDVVKTGNTKCFPILDENKRFKC